MQCNSRIPNRNQDPMIFSVLGAGVSEAREPAVARWRGGLEDPTFFLLLLVGGGQASRGHFLENPTQASLTATSSCEPLCPSPA